jgi:hypothetical protein
MLSCRLVSRAPRNGVREGLGEEGVQGEHAHARFGDGLGIGVGVELEGDGDAQAIAKVEQRRSGVLCVYVTHSTKMTCRCD